MVEVYEAEGLCIVNQIEYKKNGMDDFLEKPISRKSFGHMSMRRTPRKNGKQLTQQSLLAVFDHVLCEIYSSSEAMCLQIFISVAIGNEYRT